MSAIVDLRSDAITRPTDRMWNAMRADPLDWSRLGDRSVKRLEEYAASLLGTDDALFTPTGTMANLLALMVWTHHGDRFIVDRRAHVLTSEDHGFARVTGVHAEVMQTERGHPTVDQVAAAFARSHRYSSVRTPLVWLENTHTAAGGTIASPADIHAIAELARRNKSGVHLDGARLFNAAVALDRPAGSFVPSGGSVTVNLNKGLSAPAGALLCGPRDLIKEARARALGLGGILANAGLLAAAGLVALDKMVERLREDHQVCAQLASALTEVSTVVEALPETNIVLVHLPHDMDVGGTSTFLANRGVLVLTYGDHTLRLVTHRHVHERDIPHVLGAFAALFKGRPAKQEDHLGRQDQRTLS